MEMVSQQLCGQFWDNFNYCFFGNKTYDPVVYTSSFIGNSGFAMPHGSAVKGIGDFNGDGFKDALFSTSFDAYVVFGNSTLPNVIDTRNFNGLNGFKIVWNVATDLSIGHVKDLNKDGLSDIVLVFACVPEQHGFVIYGTKNPLSVVRLNSMSPEIGFEIVNGKKGFSSVASMDGDFDGNGDNDLLLGNNVQKSSQDAGEGFM